MKLRLLVDKFNQDNPDPCWRTPGSPARLWAEECEANGIFTHGLGPVGLPCKSQPGTTCPACGKSFGNKF